MEILIILTKTYFSGFPVNLLMHYCQTEAPISK